MSQESFNTQDHTSNLNDTQDQNQYGQFSGVRLPAYSSDRLNSSNHSKANDNDTLNSKSDSTLDSSNENNPVKTDDSNETKEERKVSDLMKIINEVKAYYHITIILGKLHYYDYFSKCYHPIHNKQKMKEIIYSYLKQKDISKVNTSFLNKCTELLMIESYPTSIPSENNGLIPFNDNVIDLNAIYDYYSMISEFKAFKPKSPNYTFTYSLKINFLDPRTVHTPNMDAYTHSVSGGDPDIIKRIWETIGYILAPDNHGKCFFLLQGESHTGKSVFGHLLEAFFDDRNITSLSFNRLNEKKSTSALLNSKLNLAMDISREVLKPKAIENLKLFTGGDYATIEHSNGNLEKFYCSSKFVFSTNSPILMKGYDDAFKDRIVCIPFRNPIARGKQNPYLINYLLSELKEIGNKAIFEYYIPLRNRGYVFSGNHLCQPVIRYKNVNSLDADISIQKFVSECCLFSPDFRCFTKDLHDAYLEYCSKYLLDPILDLRYFSRRLYALYGDNTNRLRWNKGDQNLNALSGITLRKNVYPPDDPDNSVVSGPTKRMTV